MNRNATGAQAEQLAASFLKKLGYRIVDKNYRCRLGEIDLVVKDGRTTVFVEVRSASAGFCEHPAESITLKKRRTLSMAAVSYLKEKDMLDRPSRFDVVTVELQSGCDPKVTHFQNAFEAC